MDSFEAACGLGLMIAAAVLTRVPPVVPFVFVQRRLVDALGALAVKG
jgi:ABC-type glycerol-3-phosphate transport system permease component